MGRVRRWVRIAHGEHDRDDGDVYDFVLRSATGRVLVAVHDRVKYKVFEGLGCLPRCWSFRDEQGHCVGVLDTLPIAPNPNSTPGPLSRPTSR